VSILGEELVTVKRYGPGTYVDGSYVKGSLTTWSQLGSVQPVTGEELQSLPEGRRERVELKIYTERELRSEDLVVVDGQQYQVWRDEQQRSVIPHYKAWLLRELEA